MESAMSVEKNLNESKNDNEKGEVYLPVDRKKRLQKIPLQKKIQIIK